MATDQAQEPKQIYITISAIEAIIARMEERQEQFLQRINERFDRLEARWNRQPDKTPLLISKSPDETPPPPIPVVQAQLDRTLPQEVEQTQKLEQPQEVEQLDKTPPTPVALPVFKTVSKSLDNSATVASSSATSQTPPALPSDLSSLQGLGVPYIRVATWRLRYSPGRRRRRREKTVRATSILHTRTLESIDKTPALHLIRLSVTQKTVSNAKTSPIDWKSASKINPKSPRPPLPDTPNFLHRPYKTTGHDGDGLQA